MENPIVVITQTMMPNINNIRRDVDEYVAANAGKSKHELANSYGDHICWKYSSVGAASALPGAIPGFGTAAQIGIEAGGISADLALMLRWMGSMTVGIAFIFERDISTSFNQDFVKVLGMWCGVLKTAEETSKRIGTKIAIAQFNRIPGTIFSKINKKVGTTILTKYGTKRGGIALGKLIPLGVGVIVGGGFNLATMKTFKRSAINFFKADNSSELYVG